MYLAGNILEAKYSFIRVNFILFSLFYCYVLGSNAQLIPANTDMSVWWQSGLSAGHLRTEAEAEGIYPLSRERDLHYAKRLS